jgi:O-methyltransferase
MGDVRAAYIDLLAKALTFSLWDIETAIEHPVEATGLRRLARGAARRLGLLEPPPRPRDPLLREIGLDRPRIAHTMIGLERLSNVRACVETVIIDAIPGDLIEAGVWRGGATIFMRGLLRAYGITDRRVWVADSFAGLPPPDPRYPADAGSQHHTIDALKVSLEEVSANFERYGLLDDQVVFLKGWFKDTLPTAPIGKLAVARLDGDMYESTIDALTALYPKLSPGGYLIVDDYGALPGCRRVVDDYREANGITEPMEAIEGGAVYWRRR